MVAAAHPLAVDAGVAVLRLGGSAVDAAVAVQAVLGLVEPESSGIGGGAFLLHWSAHERRVRSYDGREAAPLAARPDRFLRPDGAPMEFLEAAVGGRAVGVPGLVRLLELAHRRHGKLPWAQLFQYAIFAAEEGFPMSPRLHAALERERFLRDDPAARRIYYGEDGRPQPVGTRLVNREYGATLRAIASGGAEAFYFGDIAEDIVRAVRGHAKAGDLTLVDLARYRALERAPLCARYRRHSICGMGPPSSGGVTLLQILGILERADFHRAPPNSARAAHLFAEAGRLAYADRARYLADPEFVPVPVAGLLAREYLASRAKLIGERSLGTAAPGEPRGAGSFADAPGIAPGGTTHFSIVDARGDAVAMTSSIETIFGSRILVRGFLLNNQLTDFAFAPQAEGRPAANRVEPGKRPRSSMAPTLVFGPDGGLAMAIGSPGGPLIINYVAKALVAALDWGLDVQAAISLPNMGSMNGPTLLERGTPYEPLGAELAARGHALEVRPLQSGLHGIERVRGGWRGGADPRREGVARGGR
jgi:gamma-glutamyltranspeptidase/glutathione hydrolase